MRVKSSGVLFERGARKLGLHPVPAPLAINSVPYGGRPACVHCGFCHGFGCEVMAKASTRLDGDSAGRGHRQLRSARRQLRLAHRNRQARPRDRRRVLRRAGPRTFSARPRRGGRRERRRDAAPAAELREPEVSARPRELQRAGRQVPHVQLHLARVTALFEHELNEYKSVQVTRILHDFYDSDPKRGFYGGGGLDARIGPQPTFWAAAHRQPKVRPGARAYKERLREFPRSMQVSCHTTSLALESNNVTHRSHAQGRLGHSRDPRDLSRSSGRSRHGALPAGSRRGNPRRGRRAARHQAGAITESSLGFHLLGTCRMGNDPANSVVDKYHRSHDVPNLFICDGSSLVTSGRGQPTMTIQALAFRAGEHIARFAQAQRDLNKAYQLQGRRIHEIIVSNTGPSLRIAIAATLGEAAAPLAFAQDQPARRRRIDNIDEVVVTGTRVATRTRLDSLAPVDVLPAEALTSQGTTELAEALSTVAPSLDFPRPSITDGTDHIRPATLRGLAPDQTLVLVNSKRRHPSALVNVNGSVGRGSAAVDLNAIPLAAIETRRSAARRRLGAIRLGRHRRRHQPAPARCARRRRRQPHLRRIQHRGARPNAASAKQRRRDA